MQRKINIVVVAFAVVIICLAAFVVANALSR